MEDYRQIEKSELIKSFDKKDSFLIKVYVSTDKQPFYDDYLNDLNYELEGELYSIDNDTIKIKGKKIYYFDHEDENNEDKLNGIFTVDELTSGCYNSCSGMTIYEIKYKKSVNTKENINDIDIGQKKHQIVFNDEEIQVKKHKSK
jgi:hypothetical protein